MLQSLLLPQVDSTLCRFLQGVRTIHERAETALCAARTLPTTIRVPRPRNAFFQMLRIFFRCRRGTIAGPLRDLSRCPHHPSSTQDFVELWWQCLARRK